jgi:hypothetical protein
LFVSWVAGLWATAMWELRVPLWFSVAPIPIACFWSSWWRASNWLVERSSWRSRAKLALAIVLPLTIIAVAVICYRVYEIPAAVRIKEIARERHTEFSSPQLRLEVGDAVSELEWQRVEDVDEHAVQLAESVLATCSALERNGQLEAAFDRYVAVLVFARHLYEGADWLRQQRADAVERLVLERLPIDPFTGQSFRYQADGFEADFIGRGTSTFARESSERTIMAGTPFLWSAGPEVVYSPYTRSGPVTARQPDEYTHVDYVFRTPSGGTPQPITTDRELWTRGVCFPIPRVGVD